MPFAQQSTKAIETFLSTIKDLHVENSSGIKLYYSDSKKQEHVKKLISSQRSAPRISSNKRSRDATECNPSYIKTRTFYANNSQRNKDNGREPNSKIRKCLNSSNRSPLRTTRKKCENQFLSLAEKWRKTVDLVSRLVNFKVFLN